MKPAGRRETRPRRGRRSRSSSARRRPAAATALTFSGRGPTTGTASSMTRSDGSPIVFAHCHYVTNAGVNQPVGPRHGLLPTTSMSPSRSRRAASRPRHRWPVLSAIRETTVADVSDGLSNTVFIGEHSSVLSNKTWVGVVPGAVRRPRLDLRPWPSENNGAGCLVGATAGPTLHDHPQVIIHAPNNPFGHTDEMWGEHGAAATCCSATARSGSSARSLPESGSPCRRATEAR